jgi:tRNA pseudouridine55 synthase
VALGEATKTVGFVEGALKAYRFAVRWGVATDTDDATGVPVGHRTNRPAEGAIRAALAPLTGDILQVPPAYSAVKVAGERAYDLARAGEAVTLAARPLHVARLELVRVQDADTAELEMVCGKGGYVRGIARDLGSALGCLGHALWLRRLWSGPFTLDDALSLDEIERLAGTDALRAHLLPLERALAGIRELPCPEALWPRLSQGNPVALDGPAGQVWVSRDGRAVALGQMADGLFRPDRMIRAG